jgi:hypothetical protein
MYNANLKDIIKKYLYIYMYKYFLKSHSARALLRAQPRCEFLHIKIISDYMKKVAFGYSCSAKILVSIAFVYSSLYRIRL